MDEELIQEYLRRFDIAFSLIENQYTRSTWYIELTEEYLREHQQAFADKMLKSQNANNELLSAGALIFYGYRLGAVQLKGKNECYTRQGGYKDNAIWYYNLDEVLNEETEENNPDAGASNIIEWIINPGSNTDVADAVIGKMIIPMVKNLCRITPPGKRTECTIVMPPISKDIEIQDWSALFNGLKVNDLQIKIVDYGHLLNLDDGERRYIFQYQTDGYRQYVIVSAYEIIRGHITCLGCMAFDVEDFDHQYELQTIKPINLSINNRAERYNKKVKRELTFDWEFLNCKYPVSGGLNSFLGNHGTTFGRELYKLTGIKTDSNDDSIEIMKLFKNNEALQAIEIISRLLKESNLYNIPLGDLVYVANILERDRMFKTVSIGTNKNYKLGTYKQFAASIDLNRVHEIPANYSSITWRIKDKRISISPYFSLDVNKHSEKQIIESVVNHFEHCTTDTVADELLYLYKNGEDPSAFFAAKVFLYLSQMGTVEIESRNEFISSIENVDSIEYKEIDKSQIKATNIKKAVVQRKSIFKQPSKEAKAANILRTSIDEINLTVRSYNCLKRAGISTVGDLVNKTSLELKKIRNLGVSNQTEIINKLHDLGLKLADGK